MIDGQPRSTGDAYYAPAFLKAFGQNVILPKGNTIKGIFQRYPLMDDVGTDTANLIRYTYRLWIPKTTADENQMERGMVLFLIDQASVWNIRNYYDDGDGWYCFTLAYHEDRKSPAISGTTISIGLGNINLTK